MNLKVHNGSYRNVDAPGRLTDDRKEILPSDGPVAAHITSPSRGLHRYGPRALATAPKESYPDSGGPDSCADKSPDGRGYFTRGEFLNYYNGIDGAAWWERAPAPECRAANPDGAGIPRSCRVCDASFPSGNAFCASRLVPPRARIACWPLWRRLRGRLG